MPRYPFFFRYYWWLHLVGLRNRPPGVRRCSIRRVPCGCMRSGGCGRNDDDDAGRAEG